MSKLFVASQGNRLLDLEPGQTPSDVITTFPRATTYTVARTVNKTSVLLWETHLNRLVQGLSCGKTEESSNLLSEALKLTIHRALDSYDEKARGTIYEHWERRIWMTVDSVRFDGNPEHVVACVEPLGKPPSPPIVVEVKTAVRNDPTKKSVEWVKDRAALKEGMAMGVEEVVLKDMNGSISEGISSNFFCYCSGDLCTAPLDHVLPGSISSLVLEICDREGIQVKFEMPNIRELDGWESAFITSTSRLLLPIDEIRDYDGTVLSSIRHFPPTAPPFIEHLQRLVQAGLQEHSMKIGE